jgi:hypothetical protein
MLAATLFSVGATKGVSEVELDDRSIPLLLTLTTEQRLSATQVENLEKDVIDPLRREIERAAGKRIPVILLHSGMRLEAVSGLGKTT